MADGNIVIRLWKNFENEMEIPARHAPVARTVSLYTRLGSFPVDIQLCGDGKHRFTNGWNAFVVAHRVPEKSTLYLKKVADNSYIATVLGRNLQEIVYPAAFPDYDSDDNVESGDHIFVSKIDAASLAYDGALPLSAAFCRYNGFRRGRTAVSLIGPDMQSTAAKVKVGGDGVGWLYGGWSVLAFCNGLRIGDRVILNPIGNNTILVRVYRHRRRATQSHCLCIGAEEAAFMDLLVFMYGNTLSTPTPTAVLNLLMVADKFEVASCIGYCSRLLQDLPMTCESALLYLDLPCKCNVSMAEAVQPLADAAKKFLAASFKDITMFLEEVLNLPLAGIEAVLSNDDLQIASEDAVFDIVLKWARTHYPKLEERREILGSRLSRHIRFPLMSCRKLRKILTCNDFDPDLASKVVIEALLFKAEPPYRHRFVERSYRYRPVKILEFETPRPHCIVYLDLKREECSNLYPAGRVYSQAFHLGGQGFFLSAHCNMDQLSQFYCFGLFLGMQEKGSGSFAVHYEFGARTKPTEEYVSKYNGNYKFNGGKAVGYRNLFGIQWNAFLAEDSPYFINGILHLRSELTISVL